MPIEDNSFDLVLNVEASHCYYVEANTWQSFARVLKPGGYLMWCDMRPTELEAWMWRSAEKSGLKVGATYKCMTTTACALGRTAVCILLH
jgi:ubiquinone/menaquinone biosynthesis C-methylase UbiE